MVINTNYDVRLQWYIRDVVVALSGPGSGDWARSKHLVFLQRLTRSFELPRGPDITRLAKTRHVTKDRGYVTHVISIIIVIIDKLDK